MDIVKATPQHSLAIAELALMAGEGIPGYFWALSRKPGQSALEYGAEKAASDAQNFSYKNAHLALVDSGRRVAGMLLGYRLPEPSGQDSLDGLPAFIRPLVELEQCVPGSYYINMLATYPAYRNQGVGKALMEQVDTWAGEAGCDLISIEVFEENAGALRLYQQLGYQMIDHRDVVPHECYPYGGRVVLLTRPVQTKAGDRHRH